MPINSQFPRIDIPKCNILSFLFPGGKAGNGQLWLNADDPTKAISAGDTLSLIKRFATGLDGLSVPSQAAIMVVSPNQIYVPVIYLAATGSGRIFTAANPAYTVQELAHQMKTMRPAVILAHSVAMSKCLKAAAASELDPDCVFEFNDGDDSYGEQTHWKIILADKQAGDRWSWDPLEGDRAHSTVGVVNFSSGTTGLPKGVCTSHYNIVANALQVINGRWGDCSPMQQHTQSDRWLAFLPWYHAYAQLFSIVVSCKCRSPVYTMAEFNFSRYLKHIAKHGITTLQVVPPILVMLSKRPEAASAQLNSVKYVMSAAAPLKGDLQNSVSKMLGASVVQSWGMTETTCTGLMVPGSMDEQTGSVGYLLANTEAKLVDEEGKELSDDSTGELWIRGPQIMMKYWQNESATKETLTSEGWLKTGDVAKHQGGKWWIVDRRKELIIVKGYQVPPAELEAVLLEHKDVVDAAVVSINTGGEEHPRAYVALRPDAGPEEAVCSAISKDVATKVARHKHLSGGVVAVASIPRLQSGKIQRKVVKPWALEDAKRLEKGLNAKL